MEKIRPILKTYYDALEDGRVLGMKCKECGDVTWPPLPTCQKCGSTDTDWIEMDGEAVIDEIRFEDPTIGGDYTFRKANEFFENKTEPYTICLGRFPAGTDRFHAALFGINKDNVEAWRAKLPFTAKVHFIQNSGDFKSVGFEVPGYHSEAAE